MSLSWMSHELNEHQVAELITASDARVSERIPMRCGAKLSFETETGQGRTMKGRVLNMSTSGVLVEALRPIAIGSQVRLQANELLVGTAYVRHSTRRSWRFSIGLEFATPVRNRY
jgi:PilZ domain-containing protein